MGRDKWIFHVIIRLVCFNPRARMGRDLCQPIINVSCSTFQSTRPHGARLGNKVVNLSLLHVSIHAPAWGATPTVIFIGLAAAVSIHAPAWGATAHLATVQCQKTVSIHAPAWGATTKSLVFTFNCVFQSTRPHGARPRYNHRTAANQPFQSTRPHGARLDTSARPMFS